MDDVRYIFTQDVVVPEGVPNDRRREEGHQTGLSIRIHGPRKILVHCSSPA